LFLSRGRTCLLHDLRADLAGRYSSSAPWLMSRMLDALDMSPGMTVLEIGTGTGWNAALMAAAGAGVTTVEIDEDLAEHARTALDQAGFSDVLVVCEDGERGVPERSPYDRVLATASVHTVPYSWVEQTANGGLLVIPFTGPHHPLGLAVLNVAAGVASGRIVDDNIAFIPLRGQRLSECC
jgi:protein-L-isoaspartate(D-aspartate) O-methyltransferase